MPHPAALLLTATPSAGGTTVYVEEDFTATTTGDLSTNNLSTDEVGNGWQNLTTVFTYDGGGAGVQTPVTLANRAVLIETSGREDVQVTLRLVMGRGGSDTRWGGNLIVRSTNGSASNTGLTLFWEGTDTDPDLVMRDGNTSGTALKTWDLSVLMTTPPDELDTVDLVIRCSGNDITLYSIDVNDAGAEVIDDTYTLTGAVATTHGSGSGADWYGMNDGEQVNPGDTVYKSFKVESIP